MNPTQTPAEDERSVKLVRQLKGNADFISLTMSSALLALSSLQQFTIWAGGGILLLAVGIVVRLRRKPSFHALVEASAADRAKSEDLATSLLTALGRLMDMALRETGALEAHTRFSLYCHANSSFYLLKRVSSNPALERIGRPEYPDDQGVIGQAWQKGIAVLNNLPANRAEWLNRLTTRHGFPEDTAKALHMQSRSIVGSRIESGGVRVGVLILESTKAQGVTVETLEAIRTCHAMQAVVEILASTTPGLNSTDVRAIQEKTLGLARQRQLEQRKPKRPWLKRKR